MKTIKTILNLLSIILVFSSLFISCSKDNPTDSPESQSPIITDAGTPNGEMTTASIGASGGILNSADGKLTISIPAGALSSATEISIQPISNEAPLGLGSGYRLLPEGTTFANPVQLTFHYDEQLLQQSPEDFLWIVTQAADRSWNALLKSALDKNAKTVSVATTHFSDWVLGRFIDFTLTPSSSTVQKGKSLELKVTGFDQVLENPDQEFTPLFALTGDEEELMPLTPLGAEWENFKIRQWTMNGVVSPVSNSEGSLNASGNSAIYIAPVQKPASNPVAVSVQLDCGNSLGGSKTYFLTSNITVVDGFFLQVKIDGQEFEYLQYGFGVTPPDPNNISMVNCLLIDDRLEIYATMISISDPTKNIFKLSLTNPSETTRVLIGSNENGYDDLTFSPEMQFGYTIDYTQRTINLENNCDRVYRCGYATATLMKYSGSNSHVFGTFSGTIYEDNDALDAECKMPIAHSIKGEFWLMVKTH